MVSYTLQILQCVNPGVDLFTVAWFPFSPRHGREKKDEEDKEEDEDERGATRLCAH